MQALSTKKLSLFKTNDLSYAKPDKQHGLKKVSPVLDYEQIPTEENMFDEKLQGFIVSVQWKDFIVIRRQHFENDYQTIKELGKGAYAEVSEVRQRRNGVVRAAKKLKKSEMDGVKRESLMKEVEILSELDHPHISKLFQVYDHQDQIMLIMERCEGIDLLHYISHNSLSLSQILLIVKQLLQTLAYVHRKGIVHRDIKPNNILYDATHRVIKLIDFGIATKIGPEKVCSETVGTLEFLAPEVLRKHYNEKCDIWSVGVMLFIMLFRRSPWKSKGQQIMTEINNGVIDYRGNEWRQMSISCKQMLIGLLNKNPKKRFSAYEALKSSWLSNGTKKARSRNSSLQLRSINLTESRRMTLFQIMVHTYIIGALLTPVEKKLIEELFQSVDQDSDGVVSHLQILKYIQEQEESEQGSMYSCLLKKGEVMEYTEFLVNWLDKNELFTQEHYSKAYEYFEKQHQGFITYDDFTKVLKLKESNSLARKCFDEIDLNKDGAISKDEFVAAFVNQQRQNSKGHAANG